MTHRASVVSPFAMSVLGPVPVADLGPTLAHEHLLIELRPFVRFDEPPLRERQSEPVTLANLGWVRQYWTYSADNMVLDDEGTAISELERFRTAGGATVVDLTLPG